MRQLPLLLLILLAFLSCKKQESGTQSSSSTPNFTGNSCIIGKWVTKAPPINLKMSSDFSFAAGEIDGVTNYNPLERMAKVWNDAVSPTKTLFQLPFAGTTNTGYSSLGSFRDNEFGIYKSQTWFAGVSTSALAVTQFFGTVTSDPSLGTYINLSEADIIFNYNNFGFTFNSGYYDLQTVALHEMGHFLGLCHAPDNSNPPISIMAPYYYSTQRTLKTYDTNKIQALYLNNQNLAAISTKTNTNALSAPVGTEIKGIVELNADGNCRHFINGKLVFEHTTDMSKFKKPTWYKNLIK